MTGVRRELVRAGLAIVAVVALAGAAGARDAPATPPAQRAPDQAPPADEHAAHRAAVERPRYSVSEGHYSVPDVDLVDAMGVSVALPRLLESEGPVALNFIFTTCATICPVMTSTFAQMRHELGDDAGRVRLVSISIDPDYDRPAVLKQYAERFGAGGGWSFLTGDGARISEVLRSFDAYTGSKMNHRPVTLLKRPQQASWIRIDGLASGQDLAREVRRRLLD